MSRNTTHHTKSPKEHGKESQETVLQHGGLCKEYVSELKEDLYYDLLDKYVQLQADMRKQSSLHKKLYVKFMSLRAITDEEYLKQFGFHNDFLKMVISTVYKHGGDFSACAKEFEKMKIKTTAP